MEMASAGVVFRRLSVVDGEKKAVLYDNRLQTSACVRTIDVTLLLTLRESLTHTVSTRAHGADTRHTHTR